MIKQPNKMLHVLATKFHLVETVAEEGLAKQKLISHLNARKKMSGLVIMVNKTTNGIAIMAGEQGTLSSGWCEEEMDGVNHGFLCEVSTRDCPCGIRETHSHCFCGAVLEVKADPPKIEKSWVYKMALRIVKHYEKKHLSNHVGGISWRKIV